jgi:hypothetical protein
MNDNHNVRISKGLLNVVTILLFQAFSSSTLGRSFDINTDKLSKSKDQYIKREHNV